MQPRPLGYVVLKPKHIQSFVMQLQPERSGWFIRPSHHQQVINITILHMGGVMWFKGREWNRKPAKSAWRTITRRAEKQLDLRAEIQEL